MDKRKKILKYLYDNKHNHTSAFGDIKPLMKKWTRQDIHYILDWLESPPNSFIVTERLRDNTWDSLFRATMPDGILTYTLKMDEYIAKGYITPKGEEHYREVYKDANWKSFLLRLDAVSKPVLLLVAVGSICLSILSWRTNERLRKEVKKMQDNITVAVQKADQNYKKEILELRMQYKQGK